HLALRVGHLVAAQELLPHGVEARVPDVRVDAEMVAVPDVDLYTGQRLAAIGREARYENHEVERQPGLDRGVAGVGADIGAVQRSVDEVRTLRLRGPDDAGPRARPRRPCDREAIARQRSESGRAQQR